MSKYERPGCTPVTPIAERYAGENLPYRGIENHGVPVFDKPGPLDADELDYEKEEAFDYPSDPQGDQRPVPVYVVNNSPVEQKRWIPSQSPVADIEAVRLAGQDRRRTKLRLKVLATTDSVFIGNQPNVSSSTGVIIEGTDGWIDLVTTDEVWAICASGDSTTVHVIAECWTDLRTIEDKVKR